MGAELDEAGIAHTGSDPESDGVSAMGDVANTVGEHMKEHSQDIGKLYIGICADGAGFKPRN